MSKLNRRQYMQGVLATLAATAAPSAVVGAPHPATGKEPGAGNGSFKICLVWGINGPHRVRRSKQIGVTHAIAGTAGALRRVPRSRYVETCSDRTEANGAAGHRKN